ncbi:MAG TPA: choice-of-anchor Q domain-containing protein [Candidatus Limnocylindrales bacterium]|nr:choice-of-anchor Q domain-containing protein [Candidatus Limnocylindrales bacterium]
MPNRRRAALGALLATSLAATAFAAPAATLAAGSLITVNTTSDDTTSNNGLCSLREAIAAANANIGNTNNDCADGQGGETDDIQFSVSGTIALIAPLPDITDSVQVDGNHAIVIDAADAVRVFRVISGGLVLRQIVVQNGAAPADFGGAISNGSSTILVEVTIRSSSAQYGGAIHNNGALSIFASTIEGNAASSAGGGILNETTAALTVRNTTITANAAPEGAGVYSSGTATLAHVTIARNTANTGGGGGVKKAGGAMTIANAVIVGNTGSQTTGSPGSTGSVVQTSADGVIDTALRDNGGPTRTIRLPAGSPALSRGVHDWCNFVDYVDQRGAARPSTVGAACDAGAVQRDRTAPVLSSNPTLLLRNQVALSGSSLRAQVGAGSGSDESLFGIDYYTLQRQVNGGSWSTIATLEPIVVDVAVNSTGSRNVTLSKDTRYRFRVRAVDEDGNLSSWRYTPTVTARLAQQTSSRFTFSSGWSNSNSSSFSGGSVKFTSTDGRAVRVTVKARAVALVTTLRATKELAALVSVNGGTKSRLTASSPTTLYRAQVFPRRFSTSETRTIRYEVDTTNRFDVDAIAWLE